MQTPQLELTGMLPFESQECLFNSTSVAHSAENTSGKRSEANLESGCHNTDHEGGKAACHICQLKGGGVLWALSIE